MGYSDLLGSKRLTRLSVFVVHWSTLTFAIWNFLSSLTICYLPVSKFFAIQISIKILKPFSIAWFQFRSASSRTTTRYSAYAAPSSSFQLASSAASRCGTNAVQIAVQCSVRHPIRLFTTTTTNFAGTAGQSNQFSLTLLSMFDVALWPTYLFRGCLFIDVANAVLVTEAQSAGRLL